MDNKKIGISVRLVIIKDDKILLSHSAKLNFYDYPGGEVKFRETLAEACGREAKDQLDTNFTFQKILFIRDDIPEDKPSEHAVEFFVLGKIDKTSDFSDRPDLAWMELSKLPEMDLKPKAITAMILEGDKSGFLRSTAYVGKVL